MNATRLLITGEMRSGTTLISNFLNSQRDCNVQSDLFRSVFLEAEKLEIRDLTSPLSARERNILFSNLAAEGWQAGMTALSELDRNKAKTWLDIYHQALGALDPEQKFKVVGTKITRQYGFIEQLLKQGVRVLFCIRDPRDTLLSSKNRFSKYNLFQYCDRWKSSYELSLRFAEEENFKALVFEDLINENKRAVILKELSEFLGVNLTTDLEKLNHRSGTRFVSNTSFGDVSRLFDPKASGRWKNNLDSDEVIFASKYFSREIEMLGLEHHEPEATVYRKLKRQYLKNHRKSAIKKFILKTYRYVFK